MNENEFLIELQAKLDEAKSKENINKTDIPNLQKELDKLKIQAELDPKAVQKLADNIGKLINQKIVISNIGIDTKSGVKAGQEYGKQISQGISKGMKDNTFVLNSFKKSLENIGMGSKEIDAVASKINNLGVQIETLNQTQSVGKKDTLSVNIAGIDQYGHAIKLTQQYNTSTGELINTINNVSTVQQKAGVSVDNFAKKQSQAVNNLTNQINQLNRAANDQNSSRPITDSSHLALISNAYNDIISGIERMKNASSDTFTEEQNNVKTLISNYKSLVSEFKNAENIATQMKSTDISSGIAQAQERLGKLKANSSEFEQMAQTIRELDTAIDGVGDKSSLDKFLDDLRVAESQLGRVKAEAKQLSQIHEIQLLSNGGIKNDYSTQIAKLEGNFRNLGFTQDEIKNKTQNVTNAFEALKTRINQPFDESNYQEIILLNDKLQKELAESANEYTKLSASAKGHASVQQRLSKANIIEAWNQKNSGATKEIISNNQAYIDSLRNLNVQMSKMEFDEISDGFKKNENAMRALGKLGITFKEQMSQAAQSFTQWLSISSGVMLLISRTKNAISELKEVNTLLTEISKANDKLSKTGLIKIGNDSFDVASKYGKTATDYLAGVQEASRAGYENAMGIAELSVAAQGAGDMTAELANQYIIATDKAYKLGGSVEQLTEVLDGSNYITNHNAVNMTELAEGMSIVGSQAASLGVKVNETTAVLGTMIATTQQSGSEMARAFKAILLNLQQVTDEEEGIDAEGLTKYEEACKALNVSLKETKNGVISLRDPMEVIKDLAAEYSKLDSNDIRRTNLLSSVGGKLRANALNAILENYDMYSKMLDEYAMGTGSMAAEAEKTANSWEGSLNRLSNTWTDTIENIVNSDAIITAINSLNSLLSVINNITDKFGSLGTIGLGTGLFAGLKNVGMA